VKRWREHLNSGAENLIGDGGGRIKDEGSGMECAPKQGRGAWELVKETLLGEGLGGFGQDSTSAWTGGRKKIKNSVSDHRRNEKHQG